MNIDAYLLKEYLKILCVDSRITVWHIAMVFAFVQLADRNLSHAIYISRRRVMAHSRIKSIVTYHKYLKDLEVFGYIEYRPSYHPGVRSFVRLILAQ